jgi:hypothetical protein
MAKLKLRNGRAACSEKGVAAISFGFQCHFSNFDGYCACELENSALSLKMDGD